MPVKNRFAELQSDMAAWRRDLHAHPELGYEVHRTAGIVADLLRGFGCDEVVTGVGRTGVVGVINGNQPGSGRTIALRADMDALPIEELTGLPHASQAPGLMHACGHDGHTAMLLGAARYLAETRNFAGRAVVVFQPAEEGGAGGRAMVEDGLMERFAIDEIYGMHNSPGLEIGKFSIRSGAFFAATDRFEVVVRGTGGHAARPHTTIDPIIIAAHMVTALQTIVSRYADPISQVVLSVTAIESSAKVFNIISDEAVFRGTLRTLQPDARTMAEARLKELCPAIAAGFGATAEVRWWPGYPVMVNSEAETAHAMDAARSIAGGCDEAAPTLGAEDFAYMLEQRPGAYILVGNGDSAGLHNARYDFNDAALPYGASWYVEMVEQRLPVS